MSEQNTQTQASFDLHTSGVGYLYRLRKVSVKRGAPYWAVTIGALHGLRDQETGRFETTYIDVRVVGRLAVKRLEELVSAGYFAPTHQGKFENRANVCICFKVGDITSGFYWREEEGQKVPVPTISGRLLQIKSAKVKLSADQPAVTFEFKNQPEAQDVAA